MPSTCWNTLLIGGTDVRTWGEILSAEGLLADAPQKADLIEQDWSDGAIYQRGPKGTYSFELPLILTGGGQDVKLGKLRAVQALVGTKYTLTRRLTVNGTDIADTCSAVMTAAPQVVWQFAARSQIRVVMVWQVLTPWVAA